MKKLLTYQTTTMSIVMLVVFMATTAWSAPSLYSQTFIASGSLVASQNDIAPGGYGNFVTTYDNFTLTNSAFITNVQWIGGYWNGSPATIVKFNIAISSSEGDQPGTVLSSYSAIGNANESYIGDYVWPTYTYSLDIPGFAATGGTEYWLSIVPDIGFPPQWGLAAGTGGDGISYQDFQQARGTNPYDLSFQLSGNSSSVPEPSTFLLCGAGVAGLAFWNRRKVQGVKSENELRGRTRR